MISYSSYTGEDLGIDAEDLLQALSDFLLESGFNTQYTPFSEANEHTLEDLKHAIERALQQGKLFDDDQHAGDDGAPGWPVSRTNGEAARQTGAENDG